jgi:hypothetical protein
MNNLEEFVSKVENFNTFQASKMIAYFSYYLLNFKGFEFIQAKDIAVCYSDLNIPAYSNISKYLSDNSKNIKGKTQKYIKKKDGYVLSRQYSEEICGKIIFDLPKMKVSTNLRNLLNKLTNPSEKVFLEEAIKTFEVEAYRASIVMVWILTLDHLYEFVLCNHLQDFVSALRKINNSKVINSKDDFGNIKESIFIEACRGANIVSNDVRKILTAKLDVRNSYAHPSTIHLPQSKALEFIEDLVNNVVLKY